MFPISNNYPLLVFILNGYLSSTLSKIEKLHSLPLQESNFLVSTFSMFANYSDIEKVKLLSCKAFKLNIIKEIKMDKIELRGHLKSYFYTFKSLNSPPYPPILGGTN